MPTEPIAPDNGANNDNAAAKQVAHELRAAIDKLRSDVARVEIWAGALAGFSKPVPGYEDSGHHLLPRRQTGEIRKERPPPSNGRIPQR